jgi:hypothetical protein
MCLRKRRKIDGENERENKIKKRNVDSNSAFLSTIKILDSWRLRKVSVLFTGLKDRVIRHNEPYGLPQITFTTFVSSLHLFPFHVFIMYAFNRK